jgi:hypothetical protein
VGSPDVEVERRNCSLHRDRQAVGRCGECGREVCLSCAVPFRGIVLCTTCAARALGEPSPPAAPDPVRSRGAGMLATVLLLVAAVLTILPWHRFGPLTGTLSAWRGRPYAWPTVACVLLIAALLITAVGTIRRSGRVSAGLGSAAATLAAAATLRAILGAPDYVRHTPVPYVVLALAAGAALIGAIGPRWHRS